MKDAVANRDPAMKLQYDPEAVRKFCRERGIVELEEIFGWRVDLVGRWGTERSWNPYRRDAVLSTAQPICVEGKKLSHGHSESHHPAVRKDAPRHRLFCICSYLATAAIARGSPFAARV